jgi:hypothetical protein
MDLVASPTTTTDIANMPRDQTSEGAAEKAGLAPSDDVAVDTYREKSSRLNKPPFLKHMYV